MKEKKNHKVSIKGVKGLVKHTDTDNNTMISEHIKLCSEQIRADCERVVRNIEDTQTKAVFQNSCADSLSQIDYSVERLVRLVKNLGRGEL